MSTQFTNLIIKILNDNDVSGLEKLLLESNDCEYAQIVGFVWNSKKEYMDIIYHQLNYKQVAISLVIIKRAILSKIIEIIKITINFGINIPNKYLVSACKVNAYEIVKLLLDYGLDVNYKNSKALFVSCDYINICRLLLDYGSDITSGRCLVEACKNQNLEIVKLLLDRGFDLYYNNGEAFNVCCVSNNKKICKILLNHGYIINQNDPNFIKTIIICIADGLHTGFDNILEFLLKQGINLSHVNQYLDNEKYENKTKENLINTLIKHDINVNNIGKLLFNSYVNDFVDVYNDERF
ncbi:putative ankyrin repeat protein [Cotonvirus japonicus]|uniref:Ankyrin repeat protein n=1 Tax=Cotonvirus japonicus TaxID=2811091 RepID=A0ABM7NR17_9VIRU|nr:putative ankyrin repeat protein [Cotonvirus japonicus]BCS82584.1 putative ankyrin repeat protein [Cotonvirus japonicus]